MYVIIINSCIKNYLSSIEIMKFHSIAQINDVHDVCVYI